MISLKTQKLLLRKVIVGSSPETGEFFPGHFHYGQKDSNIRMTLNSKRFKKFINYIHFKIEFIRNLRNILKPSVS